MREVVHHSVSSLLFIDDIIFPGGEKKKKKRSKEVFQNLWWPQQNSLWWTTEPLPGWGWKDLWRSSSPTALLKGGSATVCCSGQCWILNIIKDRDYTAASNKVFQCSNTYALKKYFYLGELKFCPFQFVPIASCPVIGHH